MATFKIVVQHQRSDGFYQVYIRMTHNRRSLYIKTNKMVGQKGIVKGSHDVKDSFVLNPLNQIIEEWMFKLNKLDIRSWSAEQVRDYLEQNDADVCFSDFAREYIDELSETLKPQSLVNYRNTLNSIERYCGSEKVMFSELNTKLVQGWIDSMKDSKAKRCSRQVWLNIMIMTTTS